MNRREALFHSLSAVLSGVLAWLVPGRTKSESLTVRKAEFAKFGNGRIPFWASTGPYGPEGYLFISDRMDPWPIRRSLRNPEFWRAEVDIEEKYLGEVWGLAVKAAELKGAKCIVEWCGEWRGFRMCRVHIFTTAIPRIGSVPGF